MTYWDILLNDILLNDIHESHSWQVDMCMLHLDVSLIMRPFHVHLGGE